MYIQGRQVLNKETAKLISVGTTAIREYLPIDRKILLLDVLYALSIKTGQPHFCVKADITAINSLVDFCIGLNISPESYVSCAYDVLSKVGNHRIYVSYLLSEHIVEYCSKKVFSCSGDALIYNQVKSDITNTEKLVRNFSRSQNISYNQAVLTFLNTDKISNNFILFKRYMGVEPFASMPLSDEMMHLSKILTPIFSYITVKHGLYPKDIIPEWNNSKIECFNDCPIYFRSLYLNKELPPESLGNESTQIGTMVHKVFEDVINKYTTAKKKDIKAIFARYLKGVYFTSIKDQITEHLPGITEFFTGHNSVFHKYANENTKIYTEQTMRLTYAGTTFVGTADLILVNGDEAILMDYKTSKINEQKWIDKNNAKYHKQLSLYAQFIKDTYKVSKVTAIIVYTRGLVHVFDCINDNILAERLDDIARIRTAMKLNSFRSNSSHCFLCRHPDCMARSRESIWNPDGTRKAVKSN